MTISSNPIRRPSTGETPGMPARRAGPPGLNKRTRHPFTNSAMRDAAACGRDDGPAKRPWGSLAPTAASFLETPPGPDPRRASGLASRGGSAIAPGRNLSRSLL